jgi:hypothetical protein
MRYSIDRIGMKGVHALAVAIKQNKTLQQLDLSIVMNNIYLAFTDIDDQAVKELVQPENESTVSEVLYLRIIYYFMW